MEYKFNDDHNDPKDSQVIIALTGSAEYIREQLQVLITECTRGNKKPIQGQYWSADGSRQVTTPIWNKEKW